VRLDGLRKVVAIVEDVERERGRSAARRSAVYLRFDPDEAGE
jgi:hypothetical protein